MKRVRVLNVPRLDGIQCFFSLRLWACYFTAGVPPHNCIMVVINKFKGEDYFW